MATATDVAIVGGGVAGLAAAHALSKRGASFLLLEAAPTFGGVIRTERSEGFLMEGGPDAILAQKPEGLALCRELGLGDRLVPTNPRVRAVFVLHRGRLHPLPEGMMLAVPTRILPFLTSGLFSWAGKIRMGLDLVVPARRETGDESIADFLRRRFGQECVTRLGEPLLAGIHSGDPECLSIGATFPRFVDLERRHGSLIRGLWSTPRPAPNKTQGSAFYSLSDGLQELVEALVARLPRERLRARSPVRSIAKDASRFSLEVDGMGLLHARAVVIAAPGPTAAPLVASLDSGVAAGLAAIPFVSSATVQLGYRREDVANPLAGYGMVIPKTEGLRTNALSFFSTKFPGRAPEGHVLLRGFLGGARDPGVLDLDDAALVDTVRREMAPVLGLRGEPVLTRVCRWPLGTPQMEVGHQDRIAAIEARLTGVAGLFLTGAGVRATGIPDVVADATRTGVAAAAFVESAEPASA
jgi:protoporphyrinogen/coproporphyrinogen III oxidase